MMFFNRRELKTIREMVADRISQVSGNEDYLQYLKDLDGKVLSRLESTPRFALLEYQSGFAVQDTETGQETWMSDGVDCCFREDGTAISPGTVEFGEAMLKSLNANEAETLEAYFTEDVG